MKLGNSYVCVSKVIATGTTHKPSPYLIVLDIYLEGGQKLPISFNPQNEEEKPVGGSNGMYNHNFLCRVENEIENFIALLNKQVNHE